MIKKRLGECMSRLAEFILGFIGAVFGSIGAFITVFIGGVDASLNESGSSVLLGHGWLGFLFALIAVGGSFLVHTYPKTGGSLFILSAIGGFLSISLMYLPAAIILIIAAYLAFFKKITI